MSPKDDTLTKLPTMIWTGLADPGNWVSCQILGNNKALLIREILIANITATPDVPFALMICPKDYTASSGIDQQYVVYKKEIPVQPSVRQELSLGVNQNWEVRIYANEAVNIYISGILT